METPLRSGLVCLAVFGLACVFGTARAENPGSAASAAPSASDSAVQLPPAAPAPSAAPAPLPPAPPASAAPSSAAEPPTSATVTLFGLPPNAWLETRSILEPGPWHRICRAPCEQAVVVDSMEARVTGPSLTASNAFRIDPGRGVAKIRVDAGSSSARAAGLGALIGGLPVAMAGLFLYGYGKSDGDAGLRTAGLVTLGIGAVASLAALPLLAFGSTTVRDGRGHVIAAAPAKPRF